MFFIPIAIITLLALPLFSLFTMRPAAGADAARKLAD